MTLRRLSLARFRSVAAADLEFPAGTTLLFGANAQGKTSVLEAVSFLSRGRSFRAGRDRECIAWGAAGAENFAAVAGEFDRAGLEHRVRIAIEPSGKSVWLDGKPLRTLTELWGRLQTVIFVPADLRLLQGEPRVRRSFLDALAGQTSPAALHDLAVYGRALASRATLIRRRVPPRDAQYDAFERQMARAGSAIVRLRRELATSLTAAAADPLARLSDGAEQLEVRLQSRWPDPAAIADAATARSASETEEALAALWRAERAEDCARGMTRYGPHRDDLTVLVNGVDARTYASQGQTRSCVLALRMAELRLLEDRSGEKPLLLLDDVLGELDAGRAERFLGLVAHAGVQAVLTATDAAAVEGRLPIDRLYRVDGGEIARIS